MNAGQTFVFIFMALSEDPLSLAAAVTVYVCHDSFRSGSSRAAASGVSVAFHASLGCTIGCPPGLDCMTDGKLL